MSTSINGGILLDPSSRALPVDGKPSSKGNKKPSKGDIAILLVLAQVEAKTLETNKQDELTKKEREELVDESVITQTLQKCSTLDQAKSYVDLLKRICPKGNPKLAQFIEGKEETYQAYINNSKVQKLLSDIKTDKGRIAQLDKWIGYLNYINGGLSDLFDKCSNWNIHLVGLKLSRGSLQNDIDNDKQELDGYKKIALAKLQGLDANDAKIGLTAAKRNDMILESTEDSIINLSDAGSEVNKSIAK